MTLYKLIQAGETIPENAVYFWDGPKEVKTPFAGREYDSKRHVRHFVPVEVPDEPAPTPAPQSEPMKAVEPVWHNPDNVPMDKIPEGWRLMVPAEVDGRHKGKCRMCAMGEWSRLGGLSGKNMRNTYIVPADTPLPTEA